MITSTLKYLELYSTRELIIFIFKDLFLTAIISYVIFGFLWKHLQFNKKINYTVNRLVKNNHDKTGNHGEHLADLFLQLYNELGVSNQNNPLHIENVRYNGKSRYGIKTMAEILAGLELAIIKNSNDRECVIGKDDKFSKAVWKKLNNLRRKNLI